jgi:Flp pilus assembly protein TadG
MIMRSRHPLREQRSGSAMVEFALIAPVLLLIMAGVLDYSMALRTAICASDAARTGAQYGTLNPGNATDYAGMQNAALNSAPNITGMSATATRVCKCGDGSTITCGSTCGSGAVQIYVQVVTTATVTKWFRYAGLPFSGAVYGKAVMRAK